MDPCLCGLLETFWYHQKVLLRHNGFHVLAFPATRGTTQDGQAYPTLFNVVVDNFIRTWLAMIVENQRVGHYGLGEIVGWCLVVFYSDDDMVI